MAFWSNIRFLLGGKKDFSSGGWNGQDLEIWNPAHPLGRFTAGSTGKEERIENDFEAYVTHAFKENGAVFACVQARQMVFSEAKFIFREYGDDGRPGRMHGSSHGNGALSLLRNPWPNGTTGELLARMEQDVFFSGNFFATTVDDSGRYGKQATGAGRRIVRLRPDWVTMLIGTKRDADDYNAIDAQVLAYVYQPRANGLMSSGSGAPSGERILLMPDEVCHYSPVPDPLFKFRGMSWITPIIREIEADTNATIHKKQFFKNSAVPNMVVKFGPETDEDVFDDFVGKFQENHQGAWNSYKTLFLMGGADVTPLSHDFRQLDFSNTVGKGESRIAAAAGVPSSWVGFSEGMQGSALNGGNFNAARRRFADGTIRPLWRMAAASLAVLVAVPAGSELIVDERDIPFLREDAQDRAEIMRVLLNACDAGIKAGYKPDAVTQAVELDDISLLRGQHTGLVSVQMQAPRTADSREFGVDATAVAALAMAGYARDSIVAAAAANDISLLKPDPNALAVGQSAGGHPTGPGSNSGGGAEGGDLQREDNQNQGEPKPPKGA